MWEKPRIVSALGSLKAFEQTGLCNAIFLAVFDGIKQCVMVVPWKP